MVDVEKLTAEYKQSVEDMQLFLEVEEIEDMSQYQDICGNFRKYGKKVQQPVKLERDVSNEVNNETAPKKREFLCKRCLVLFFSKEELMSHVTHAHNLTPVARSEYTQCADCKQSIHVLDFPKHFTKCINRPKKKKVSKYGPGPHVCETCGKVFKSYLNLVEHSRHHTGNLLHCDKCGKGFHNKTGLNEHMKTHSTARPFKCKQCGRGFKTWQVLQSHEVIHSDIWAFECKICDKKFKQRQALRNHNKQYHSDNFSHTCPHCFKKFKFKSSMKEHVAERHEQRRHMCTYCSAKYVKKTDLIQHINKMHIAGEGFTCQVCGEVFSGIRKLEKHKTAMGHWQGYESTQGFLQGIMSGRVPSKNDEDDNLITIQQDVEIEEEVLPTNIRLEATSLNDHSLNQFIMQEAAQQHAHNVVLRVLKK